MSDDDLSALLPNVPPPRPARREAAIDAALRRFVGLPDGAEQGRGSVPPTAQPARRRPQFAMLTTAAMLAVIGVPLAVMTMRDAPPVLPARTAAPTPAVKIPPAGCRSADCSNAVPSPRARDPRIGNADSARLTEVQGGSATTLSRAPTAIGPQRREANPLAPLAPAQSPFSRVAPSAAAPPPPPTPPPPLIAPRPQVAEAEATANRTAGLSEDVAASASAEVVVTGSRVRNSRALSAASRGDWNACTVEDPERDLSACRGDRSLGERLSPAAAGAIREALTLSWRGQEEDALASLGRAIDLAPRSAVPLLNRALLREREGDFQSALADLDRADRIHRNSARILYHRSVVLRRLGEERRARRAEQRALHIDERYGELVD